MRTSKIIAQIVFFAIIFLACEKKNDSILPLKKNDHIVLIGNNLASRMLNFGHFETEMHLRYPDSSLFIRNMADPGNTAGFRPHSSRKLPWAFPGAEKFYQNELKNTSGSQGFFPTEDEWLTNLEADVILAFFGYNESFQGASGLQNFKEELHAFIEHSQKQDYNGTSSAQLVLVSPIAFEDLSSKMDLPNGIKENKNLKLYTEAMREVATQNKVPFIDAFTASQTWMNTDSAITADGFQLNDHGYRKFSKFLADSLFGIEAVVAEAYRTKVHSTVMEKNWFWHNEIKLPNGVHAWGRRYDPFGPDNYPFEKEKINQMIAIRDTAIWHAARGKVFDLAEADAKTTNLPPIKSNYDPGMGNVEEGYKYGQDALDRIKVAPGYKLELFASEKEFPDLANPVQMSFDNKGRLWVGVMPSYPHYKPGDKKPEDKLIILEDTNNDGKADKQTTFVDNLNLVIGFEFAPDGVYVSQGTNLVLLKDTDGDDKADEKEIILSGFDDHDTHHTAGAFAADPSGAIYMGEGVFLHTNVETAYGTVRATNGGFYRYSPQRHHLERTAQLPIPNPWGIAFD